MKDSF